MPFGRGDASYFAAAAKQQRATWIQIYSDREVSPLAVAERVLGDKPQPVPAWVVVRGLLDAVGVALLYLAVRSLLGPLGGALTALLYAASPWAWELARDPDGSLGPMLTAAAMLAAVWLIRRPTLVRGAVFGLALGLLARSLPFGPLVVPLGAAALAVGRTGWLVSGVAALALIASAAWALAPPLRSLLGGTPLIDPATIQPLFALLLASPMMVRTSAARWVGRIGVAILVVAGAIGIAWTIEHDSEAEWLHPAFIIRPPNPPWVEGVRPQAGGSLSLYPSYREVVALTRAMQEAAGRANASEIVLLNNHLPEPLTPFSYGAMLDGERLSPYGGNVILPLERETVFLAASEGARPGSAERAIETRRPSSSLRIFTATGADTGLELFTLRPRSAADWLARVQSIPGGEFVDGIRLLGVDAETRGNGVLDVAFYWALAGPNNTPVTANRRPEADRIRLSIADTPAVEQREGILPPVGFRRKDYLLLMQFRLTGVPDAALAGSLRVTLVDERFEPIRTSAGDAYLDVPLRGLAR